MLFQLISGAMGLTLPVIIFLAIYLSRWLRVLNEYERGVIFRLGRVQSGVLGPGLRFLIAPGLIDRMVKVDLRVMTLDVPPQDVITLDNVSIKVNAVVYYRVVDPVKAVVEIDNFAYATSQMAQTTLRSVVGQGHLDDLLSQREKINHEVQSILAQQTSPWGIQVTNVEVKNVDLPEQMQRAMAKQAEAERERRAKIINAEGEFQAAQKLVEAADIMEEHPMALQMRYLQTMVEIGAEKNTTILFPMPVDMLSAFQQAALKFGQNNKPLDS
jgi:regulator of protease activity HflC (stomatin/prohibitin superfamily)